LPFFEKLFSNHSLATPSQASAVPFLFPPEFFFNSLHRKVSYASPLPCTKPSHQRPAMPPLPGRSNLNVTLLTHGWLNHPAKSTCFPPSSTSLSFFFKTSACSLTSPPISFAKLPLYPRFPFSLFGFFLNHSVCICESQFFFFFHLDQPFYFFSSENTSNGRPSFSRRFFRITPYVVIHGAASTFFSLKTGRGMSLLSPQANPRSGFCPPVFVNSTFFPFFFLGCACFFSFPFFFFCVYGASLGNRSSWDKSPFV